MFGILPTLHVAACFCCQVLHWFEHNLPVVAADGDGGRDYTAEAKLLACRLLEEQCGTVALLLTSMSKVRGDRNQCINQPNTRCSSKRDTQEGIHSPITFIGFKTSGCLLLLHECDQRDH
jgi:hypothetical protein